MADLDDFLDEPEGLSDEERELAKQRRRARTAQGEAGALRAEIKHLEELLDKERKRSAIVLGLERHKRDSYEVRVTPALGSSKVPCFAVAALSDIHPDEIVDPARVNGLNEQTPEIAHARLEAYWQSTAELLGLHGATFHIHTLVLWLGGDLFSGHIHEDLIESTAMTPYQSALWLRPRLAGGIRFIRERFHGRMIIACNYGNHGRDGRKPRVATASEHNLDWLIYQYLAQDLAELEGVEWVISEGYHAYVTIDGFTLRTHHGDYIGYQGGVGGLTIPLNKAINLSWNHARHADLDLLGHWHQLMHHRNFVVNGSVIGWNPYAIKVKAVPEPPQQAFFVVNTKRQEVTAFAPIHVQ